MIDQLIFSWPGIIDRDFLVSHICHFSTNCLWTHFGHVLGRNHVWIIGKMKWEFRSTGSHLISLVSLTFWSFFLCFRALFKRFWFFESNFETVSSCRLFVDQESLWLSQNRNITGSIPVKAKLSLVASFKTRIEKEKKMSIIYSARGINWLNKLSVDDKRRKELEKASPPPRGGRVKRSYHHLFHWCQKKVNIEHRINFFLSLSIW